MVKPRQLCLFFILLLVSGIGLPDAQAQSRNSRTGSDPVDEDVVPTVNVGNDKSEAGTSSGEKEGVVQAPEFKPEPTGEQKGEDKEDADDAAGRKDRNNAASETNATTRVKARTMELSIPAPRGQILDRHGAPLAQTQVAYQLAIRFGQFEDENKEHIIGFARKCLDEAHKIAEQTWEFSDDKLWEHYRHRRWLPLPVTNVIRADAAEKVREKVEKINGLELLPIYIRYYPEKNVAAHIVGYVGSKGKLPTGPIGRKDPLWEKVEGRSGLEAVKNDRLEGKDGVWRLMFDEEGTKILDELQVKPRPGGSLVTTIDLNWQKEAEKALAKGARRGAMVVLDCKTGEVLVMASTPSYDPNIFIPNISQKDYDELRNNPANPLVSRAFQGRYPPASTFKVVTVLSALTNGTITENQTVYCGTSFTIGNHAFYNHNKKVPVGNINCIQGLALSNNPFMIQIATKFGRGNAAVCADVLLTAAKKLGFGSKTGLPIPDEKGLVPDDRYMVDTFRRGFMLGDVANMSIGQGVLLATPLQVAHAMAGIANGYGLPKLHLIKQVQDSNGNVIEVATPEIETPLAEYEEAAAIVRKGMRSVTEGGTGSRAKLSYTSIAGKTGTGQWGPEKENKRLAWFAGFLPCDNPRFAYAVLYEGLPNEKIGGGAVAAPIVKTFFEAVKADVKNILNPQDDTSIPVAEPVDVPTPSGDQPNPSGISEVPSGLPDGLYDPNDVQPVPAGNLPGDIDDAADRPSPHFPAPRPDAPREDSVPSLLPKPGDPDYIPGLQEQIPRHLNRPVISSEPSHDDDVPIAEPVVYE